MGVEPNFSSAQISFVVHATEDGTKILDAIEKVLSIPRHLFSAFGTEGHFKNSIALLTCNLASDQAKELSSRIISLLSNNDRIFLLDSLSDHSDEKGNLFIRIDKQRICQGRIALGQSDSVRIRLKPIHRFNPARNLEKVRGSLSFTSE